MNWDDLIAPAVVLNHEGARIVRGMRDSEPLTRPHRDRAKHLAYQRDYYRKNKARVLARAAARRERKPEYNREWRNKNPDYHRLHKAERRRRIRAALGPAKRVNNLPKKPRADHCWRAA